MRYVLRFIAREGYWRNKAAKEKGGRKIGKKEAVVPALSEGGDGGSSE